MACGTGEHARLLSTDFSVDGLDLEPEFVTLAQSKSVRGRFSVADMRHFELGRTYDVVICLFSSIGYLLCEEDVVKAFECFSTHVAQDGVVIVEPWFTPDKWEIGRPWLSPPVDLPDLKICRMNVSDRRGDLSLLRFQYLIATPSGIEHVHEEHELAMYTNEQLLKCFGAAGLVASHESVGLSGRGLYIARKPPIS